MNKIFDSDYLRELLSSLTRNKSRSILTGFGVFWGLFMLLALSGGAQGLKVLLSENFEGFASNSGFIVTSSTTKAYAGYQKGRTWTITQEDIEAVKCQISEIEQISPLNITWGVNTSSLSHNYNEAGIKAFKPNYNLIQFPKIKYGRALNALDELNKRKVCVIGRRVYENLFPEGGDPCGEYIKVNGVSYKVVGVDFAEGGINVGSPASQTISIPISIYNIVYNKGNKVDILTFTVKPGIKVNDVLEKVRLVLCRRHNISTEDQNAVQKINTEAIFSMVENLMKGVDILILLVGLGTILAGAIGISNIMMVTVKERTIEIGIRRAIGATPNMILGQIISESIILTLFSGLLGLVCAVGLLSLSDFVLTQIGKVAHFQISFTMAVISVSSLVALGVLAGLPPALRAMRIKPVEAMKDE